MRAFLFVTFALGVACGGQVGTAIDAGPKDSGGDVVYTGDGSTSCNTNTDCRSDGYCDYHGRCALSSNRYGQCIFKPTTCPALKKPEWVCGCDGKAYPSDCEAKKLGIDVNDQGGCPSPQPGYVACGSKFCNSATEYCIVTSNDELVPNDPVPLLYACAPLPQGCTTPTCQCFPQGIPCSAAQCKSNQGLVTVTCPGG